jgi:hypothetical protein
MGNENVSARWNQRPALRQSFSPWKVERPGIELRLPGTARQLQSRDERGLILKIQNPRTQSFYGSLTITKEDPIMVARDDDLEPVRQTVNPSGNVSEFVKGSNTKQVPGMYEQVPRGYH